jgi:hypothetical protein
MPGTKITIAAKVVKIHPGYTNDNGRYIRTIDVTAFGSNKPQNYRLTEVEEKPRGLIEGTRYEFECFLNGLRREGRHENNLLITKAYHIDDAQ